MVASFIPFALMTSSKHEQKLPESCDQHGRSRSSRSSRSTKQPSRSRSTRSTTGSRKHLRSKKLSSDDNSACSEISDGVNHRHKRLQRYARPKRPRNRELTSNDDSTSNKTATNSDVDSHSVCVAVTHNSVRRRWDRKHFCKFSMTAQYKLSRHVSQAHGRG